MGNFFQVKPQVLKTPEQAYSELLGNSAENQIIDLNIDLIDEIDNQPQKIHDDKITRIVESMKIVGQLDPVIVIPNKNKKDRFTLLAGRHRCRACKQLGLDSVKAIIKQETNPDKQRLMLLATNNDRNIDYAPSEIAFSYLEQMQLLKKLGSKSTSSQIALENNTNRKTVHKYIQLTNLIEPLLSRVDSNSITVGAGYELSFLSREKQIQFFNFILNHSDCKVDKDIARKIRFDPDNLSDLFYPPAPYTEDFFEGKAEKEKHSENNLKVKENQNDLAEKCPSKGHLKNKEELPIEIVMSVAAIIINNTSSLLKYYATVFPTPSDVENVIYQRYAKTHFSFSGNTSEYEMPYTQYNNCFYHVLFDKKLNISIDKTEIKISYKELDSFLRRYLRKYMSTAKLINIIKESH